MNGDDEHIPDTQPCEILTPSQPDSQEVNSQPVDCVWGQLIPSPKSLGWGINVSLIPLSRDRYRAGRNLDCDIVLDSKSKDDKYVQVISKYHFDIVREVINSRGDAVIVLYDKSANGTFINKKLVGRGRRCVLDNNDVIALSKPTLTIWKFVSLKVYEKTDLAPELHSEYVVLKLLGKGACGDVNMIYSKSQYRALALKAIPKHNSSRHSILDPIHDPNKIMNEVRILKALNNPFIIKMEHIVDAPSKLFIILELMEGGDLYDRIQLNHGLKERQTKFIFHQLVRAVTYLHSHAITHRDLKPENILLASDAEYPHVKISDFGLSKLVDDQTLMKTFCGTPLYVAPEVLKTGGRGAYTNLVDVWSLGVILYVTLTGTIPFRPKDPKISLQNQILKGMYSFPEHLFARISPAAKTLIKGMMTVIPARRKTIRQVMVDPWFCDRQIRLEVERLISGNNENTAYNDQDMEIFQPRECIPAEPDASNGYVFGIPGPVVKRPRIE